MYKNVNDLFLYLLKCSSIIIRPLAILVFLVGYTLPCYASWQKSDIGFAFGQQEQLVIGDGRDDGVMRLYSGDGNFSGCNGNIYEFGFSNNQWDKTNIVGDLCHITGIDIGSGRNNGVNSVYASGYNMAEYSHPSGSWVASEIGPDIQWTNDLLLGDARNDGKERVYIAEWDGILELTYGNGSWHTTEIDTGGQSIGNLVIADGRNDGVLRLYAATDWDDHVYEYTWTGSSWQVDDCGASGGISFGDMVAGDGRNDGVKRIYLAANAGGIYELSYDGSNWQYSVVANPAPMGYVGTLSLGNGRNDGINRVYARYSPSYNEHFVAEFTYNGIWSKTSEIDPDLQVNDITLGNGRNDSMNRVYVSAADNHVYEYSFKMPGPVAGIRANASDGPITLNSSDSLSITVELNPGSSINTNADWWAAYYNASSGWFYYDLVNGWINIGDSLENISVSYQGPLFSLTPFEIFNSTDLAIGTYQFYFGFDTTMNGLLDGSLSYDGVTVAIRNDPQPSLDITGTWNGTWNSSVYGISGSFKANIAQQGSTLSGSIDIPEIGISGEDLVGTLDGNTITFGDIGGQITFTGTVSGNTAFSGTYIYPSFSDNGTWEGSKKM